MGMSSSQARLLTLTARMHDIEYRAQRLEAQKLQMANESRRAYESYLEALDAKKIQYKGINGDGSITFRDATLAILENGAVPTYDGETSNKTFLIKNASTDEVYMTKEFADYYGFEDGENVTVTDFDSYLRENGATPHEITYTEPDYENIIGINPVGNRIVSEPQSGTSPGTVNNILTNSILISGTETPHPVVTNLQIAGIIRDEECQAVDLGSFFTLSSNNTYLPITSEQFNISNLEDINGNSANITTTFGQLYGISGTGKFAVVDPNFINGVNLGRPDESNYTIIEFDENSTWESLLQSIANAYEGIEYVSDNNNSASLNVPNGFFFCINAETGYEQTQLAQNILRKLSPDYSFGTTNKKVTSDMSAYEYWYSKMEAMSPENQGAFSLFYSEAQAPFIGIHGVQNSGIEDDVRYYYNGEEDLRDITLGQWLENIKNQINEEHPEINFEYEFDEENGGFSITSNSMYEPFSPFDTYGNTAKYDTNIKYIHTATIDTWDLAQGIYGIQAIHDKLSPEEYNNDVANKIKAIEQSIYDKIPSDEAEKQNFYKQLARMGAEIDAYQSANYVEIDYERINKLVEKIDNFFNTGSYESDLYYSDDIVDVNEGTDRHYHYENEYEFTLSTPAEYLKTDSQLQIREDHTKIEDGSKVKCPSKEDILNSLALAMYNRDGSKTKEEYLERILLNINSRGGLTNSQWASLCSTTNFNASTQTWNSAIIDALFRNDSITEFLNEYKDVLNFEFAPSTWNNGSEGIPASNGQVNIPTDEGIASNLEVAFKKLGLSGDVSAIISKLASTSDLDKANINALIYNALIKESFSAQDNSTIQNIYNYIFNNETLNIASTYSNLYDIFQNITGTCEYTYGTKEIGTGEYDGWEHDSIYNELLTKWSALTQLSGMKVKIVSDELAHSTEFVNNLLTLNDSFLLEFDMDTLKMTDLNVAVTTHLQEVANEKDLKKAEAKYEADMRRIDQKDRRYDTQLAALDTERNAVKLEMDTLKTVSRDNVDRTFKLFS